MYKLTMSCKKCNAKEDVTISIKLNKDAKYVCSKCVLREMRNER